MAASQSSRWVRRAFRRSAMFLFFGTPTVLGNPVSGSMTGCPSTSRTGSIVVSRRAAVASSRSCLDLSAIPIEPTSVAMNSAAAFGRRSWYCASPGTSSERIRAARGESGTRQSGCGCCTSPAMTTLGTLGGGGGRLPGGLQSVLAGCAATAVSTRCACAIGGASAVAKKTASAGSAVAGECGNRTHPARLGRVTPVLKTGEATRPHPPPFLSVNHDSNVLSLEHFADIHRSFDFRKIAGGSARWHGDEQSPRRLGITQQRTIIDGRAAPINKVLDVLLVTLETVGSALTERFARPAQDRYGSGAYSERHLAGPRNMRCVAKQSEPRYIGRAFYFRSECRTAGRAV